MVEVHLIWGKSAATPGARKVSQFTQVRDRGRLPLSNAANFQFPVLGVVTPVRDRLVPRLGHAPSLEHMFLRSAGMSGVKLVTGGNADQDRREALSAVRC